MHDASVCLVGEDLPWQFPAQAPVEVICHGDPAPYNCAFDGDRLAGIFDFDCAKKGPRALDLAQAFYRFFPYAGEGISDAQIEDMRDMIAQYGGDDELFESALRTIPWWLGEMMSWLEREAAHNPLVAKSLARGDRELYLAHQEYYEALVRQLV